jgi:hypothetical protein
VCVVELLRVSCLPALTCQGQDSHDAEDSGLHFSLCVCCEVKTCGKQRQEQVVSSYPGVLEVSDVGAAVGCLDSLASCTCINSALRQSYHRTTSKLTFMLRCCSSEEHRLPAQLGDGLDATNEQCKQRSSKVRVARVQSLGCAGGYRGQRCWRTLNINTNTWLLKLAFRDNKPVRNVRI